MYIYIYVYVYIQGLIQDLQQRGGCPNLGGLGACPPGKFLKFTPLKGNFKAFINFKLLWFSVSADRQVLR